MKVASKFHVDISKRASRIALSGIRVIFEKAQKMSGVTRLELGEPDFDTPRSHQERCCSGT